MDDYEGLCIHGTLPLVPDPGSPAGVRFAVPGRDLQDDCARVPADLPDAEMTLRFFAGGSEMAPYAAALSEHGGNAFSCVESRACHAAPVMLVVRHDRPRRPGPGLDDAVAATVPVGAAAAWGESRRRAFEAADASRTAQAHGERWVAHAALLRGMPGVVPGGVDGGGAGFSLDGLLGKVRLGGDAAGPSLTWEPWGWTPLSDDVAASLAVTLASLAGPVSLGPRGAVTVRVAGLTREDLASGIGTLRSAGREHGRAAAVSGARSRLSYLVGEGGSRGVVARLAAGLPILSTGPGRVGVMPGPGPGGCVQLYSPVVDRLELMGVAELAWDPARSSVGDAGPCLIVGTEAARLLASGRVAEAAAATVGERSRWRPRHRGSLADALAAVAVSAGPSDALDAALARIPGGLPPDGFAPSELAGRDPAQWMPSILAVLSGAATLDEEGRLRNAGGPRPGP